MTRKGLAQSIACRAISSLALILAVGTGAAFAQPVTSQPSPERGQDLASRLCSSCHLISSEQKTAVADVPSFAEIANKPDQTEGAIMARIVIPKHPMPVIPITKPELEDLSAYIMSLREEPGD